MQLESGPSPRPFRRVSSGSLQAVKDWGGPNPRPLGTRGGLGGLLVWDWAGIGGVFPKMAFRVRT